MVIKTLILISCFLVTGCAGASISNKYSQGEFANYVPTSRHEIQASLHLNEFIDADIRVARRKSERGAVDGVDSLIVGDEYLAGLSIHNKTDRIRYLVNDESFLVEFEDKRLVYGRFGILSGVVHRNKWRGGRKATGARIGAFFRQDDKTEYLFSWDIRNNTIDKTDDYLSVGIIRQF